MPDTTSLASSRATNPTRARLLSAALPSAVLAWSQATHRADD